jgi:hypothetical protein
VVLKDGSVPLVLRALESQWSCLVISTFNGIMQGDGLRPGEMPNHVDGLRKSNIAYCISRVAFTNANRIKEECGGLGVFQSREIL